MCTWFYSETWWLNGFKEVLPPRMEVLINAVFCEQTCGRNLWAKKKKECQPGNTGFFSQCHHIFSFCNHFHLSDGNYHLPIWESLNNSWDFFAMVLSEGMCLFCELKNCVLEGTSSAWGRTAETLAWNPERSWNTRDGTVKLQKRWTAHNHRLDDWSLGENTTSTSLLSRVSWSQPK